MTTDLEAVESAVIKYGDLRVACAGGEVSAFEVHEDFQKVSDLFKEQQAEIKKRHTDKQVAACIEALKMVPLEDAREMMEVLVLATAVTKQDVGPEAAAEIVKAVLKQHGFEV